jgi:hypothetical protein
MMIIEFGQWFVATCDKLCWKKNLNERFYGNEVYANVQNIASICML